MRMRETQTLDEIEQEIEKLEEEKGRMEALRKRALEACRRSEESEEEIISFFWEFVSADGDELNADDDMMSMSELAALARAARRSGYADPRDGFIRVPRRAKALRGWTIDRGTAAVRIWPGRIEGPLGELLEEMGMGINNGETIIAIAVDGPEALERIAGRIIEDIDDEIRALEDEWEDLVAASDEASADDGLIRAVRAEVIDRGCPEEIADSVASAIVTDAYRRRSSLTAGRTADDDVAAERLVNAYLRHRASSYDDELAAGTSRDVALDATSEQWAGKVPAGVWRHLAGT